MPGKGAILVTGGTRRLGLAIAEGLRSAGHHVMTTERADLDLGDADAIADLGREFAGRGVALAGLVNNAAVFELDDLDTIDPEAFLRHQRINVLAPLLLIKALRPCLAAGGGAVVNILDHNIENPNIDFLSYKLSKFALAGATRILARQLAPAIRVNGVAPGLTLPSPLQSEADFADIHDKVPLGRGSTPEDVAAAVLYLIEAPAITGQILFVDGGERFLARRRDVSVEQGEGLMLFLMNTLILELDGSSDPRGDPGFPLKSAELNAIPVNSLIGMLTQEFGKDPEFVFNSPVIAMRFAWMLYLRAEINAVKMIWNDGVSAQYGKVPELALGILLDMQTRKALTMDIIDQAVWNKLQKQK